MGSSSVSVVSNALRLRFFTPAAQRAALNTRKNLLAARVKG
jgi:hypothetical protein